MTDHAGPARTERPSWPVRLSLASRILAVNVIALGLLAGSLFYIDSYRNELMGERFQLAKTEAEIIAHAIETMPPAMRLDLLVRVGREQQLRLRLFDREGTLIADSFELAEPVYRFVDPAQEPWHQKAARLLDSGMDLLLGAPEITDYSDPGDTAAAWWPEIAEAAQSGTTSVFQRLAPDRTPVISAATPAGDDGAMLLTTRNARDITQNVRDARQTLVIIVGAALIVSILLSLFLARTIVQPLRDLVRAAIRVRLGRDRKVVVPRLPDRRDEIGLLARAIADMTGALRQRIDAVESFAADVAHELKNPLTSLRSAIESLERVEDEALRRQLTAIAKQDVGRIDRLVTEIADASRIDAQLSRTTFEPVDMGRMVRALIAERDGRGVNQGRIVAVSCLRSDDLVVAGDAARLERVLHNLLDNAISFSGEKGTIEIELSRADDARIQIAISDHGPGIPESEREKVFHRFHSLRPAEEDFGEHSGLGLAIAKTIVEAHYGTIRAEARADGKPGARLVVELPAWDARA